MWCGPGTGGVLHCTAVLRGRIGLGQLVARAAGGFSRVFITAVEFSFLNERPWPADLKALPRDHRYSGAVQLYARSCTDLDSIPAAQTLWSSFGARARPECTAVVWSGAVPFGAVYSFIHSFVAVPPAPRLYTFSLTTPL